MGTSTQEMQITDTDVAFAPTEPVEKGQGGAWVPRSPGKVRRSQVSGQRGTGGLLLDVSQGEMRER